MRRPAPVWDFANRNGKAWLACAFHASKPCRREGCAGSQPLPCMDRMTGRHLFGDVDLVTAL